MCELRVRGVRVPMSILRLGILAYLLEAGGRIVPRDELYRRFSSRAGLGGKSRAMDVHIFHIRRALGDLGHYVIAVPGAGYRIDAIGLSQEV